MGPIFGSFGANFNYFDFHIFGLWNSMSRTHWVVDPNSDFTRICGDDIWIFAINAFFHPNHSYAMFHWQFLPSFTAKWDFVANRRNAQNLTTNFLVFALYGSLSSYEGYHG